MECEMNIPWLLPIDVVVGLVGKDTRKYNSCSAVRHFGFLIRYSGVLVPVLEQVLTEDGVFGIS
jgi:hypothetical protein